MNRYRYCAQCGRVVGRGHGSMLVCRRCAEGGAAPTDEQRQLDVERAEWLARFDASFVKWRAARARERAS